jgi:hypothetical protein
MDSIIIALYHRPLLRKFNLFFSKPTSHPSTLIPSFFGTSRFSLVRFFFGGGGEVFGVWSLEKKLRGNAIIKEMRVARIP